MKGDEDSLLPPSPTRRLRLHSTGDNDENIERHCTDFGSYGCDNDSPIDLRKKKPAPKSENETDDIGNEARETHGVSPNSERTTVDTDMTAEWLKHCQKVAAASTNPSLAHHFYYGGMAKNLCGALKASYSSLPFSNPFLLNPLAFTGLGPLLCDQFGIRYALVRSPDGTQVVPIPIDRPQYGVVEDDRLISNEKMVDQLKTHQSSESLKGALRENQHWEERNSAKMNGHSPSPEHSNFVRSLPSYDGSYPRTPTDWLSRSGGTPPDNGQHKDLQRGTFRSSGDSHWHFEPKQLQNGFSTRSIPTSFPLNQVPRGASPCVTQKDTSDRRSPLKERTLYQNTTEMSSEACIGEAEIDEEYEEVDYEAVAGNRKLTAHRRRSLSCSRLPDHSINSRRRNRYHSGGYMSDSEVALKGDYLIQKTSNGIPLKKRPTYNSKVVVRSLSDMRILRRPHSPQFSHVLSTHSHSKRLKVGRSLSESSLKRKPNAIPISTEDRRPKELSTKVPDSMTPSSEQEHETFLQRLRHMAPAGFQWNVYGYYSHLMRKFQDPDTLKRYLGIDGNASFRAFPPPSAEFREGRNGVSPPTSPNSNSPILMRSISESPLHRRVPTVEVDENGGDLGAKKRASRALTGKHVKHGTGASPATLLTLRQKIQERQRAKELGLIHVRPNTHSTTRNKNSLAALKKQASGDHSASKGNKKSQNKAGGVSVVSLSLPMEKRTNS